MADYRPNARWEPGGTMPFEGETSPTVTTTGNPMGYYTLPNQQGAQLNSTATQGYMQGLLQQQVDYRRLYEQQTQMLRDLFMYGRTTVPAREAPKPLSTKALSPEDREGLEKALPF